MEIGGFDDNDNVEDPYLAGIVTDEGGPVEDVPQWLVIWGRAVETVLSTIYFLFISLIAMAIDVGLHWFEKRWFIEKYGLSAIIRWEIELMAYTLAGVDCFLFVRRLIQPVVMFVIRLVKR